MAVWQAEDFGDGLRKRISEVECHALREVRRLSGAVERLRAENEHLRYQLSKPALALDDGEELEAESIQLRDPDAKAALAKSSALPGLQSYRASEASIGSKAGGRATSDVREIIARKRSTIGTEAVPHYKTSGAAQRMARSPIFRTGAHILVLLNAVWIAIDLDFNGRQLLESPLIFQVMEHLFVAIFLSEMAVRFAAFERKRNVLRDAWFIFDSALVLAMVLESWVLTLIVLFTRSSNIRGLDSLAALRNLRLLRVARVARICRAVPELKTMATSLAAGMRSVLIAAVMLLAVTCIFGIFLRQLGSTTAWGAEYFQSVPQSICSLLVLSMLPDHASFLFQMSSETWYCGLIYFVFLVFTAIMIMNMLVGILCDVVFRESSAHKEQRLLDSMSDRLRSILRSVDLDANGSVSKSEFDSIIENEDAVRTLADVGVDVVALVDESDFIFNHQGRSVLPFQDFKEEVLKFRSTHYATIGSMMASRRLICCGLDKISDRLATLELLAIQQQPLPEQPCAALLTAPLLAEPPMPL